MREENRGSFMRSLLAGEFGTTCAVGPWAVTPDGYAVTTFAGRKWRVGRYVYTIMRGPIPPQMVVSPTCRNRACVNPLHLELLTYQEGTRRGQERRADRPTHCKAGHTFDQVNTKITRSGARVCRRCRNARSREWVRGNSRRVPSPDSAPEWAANAALSLQAARTLATNVDRLLHEDPPQDYRRAEVERTLREFLEMEQLRNAEDHDDATAAAFAADS